MSKLNTKGTGLRNLEKEIQKELNSELPVEDRKMKEFLLNALKSYRLTTIKEGLDLNEPEGRYFSIIYRSSPSEFGVDAGKAIRYIEELSKEKQIITTTDKKGEVYKITLIDKKRK